VEQEEQKSAKKSVLSVLYRWLLTDKGADEAVGAAAPTQELSGHPEEEPLESAPFKGEMSHSVISISERLAILKKTLEFEEELKSRLDGVRSYRELVLYIYDSILMRFTKLREIGLITPRSSEVIAYLNDKTTTMLSVQGPSEADETAAVLDDLRKENEELKKEVASLHARYVKGGVITDTELELEKEVKYLEGRVREQHTQIGLARKKIKALMPYLELAQNLKARTSLLQSRVEHQAGLLRSLTMQDPKHGELLSTVERLKAENRHLKEEMKKQIGLLSQLKESAPSRSRPMLDELIAGHTQLHRDLEQKHEQFEGVLSATALNETLLEVIERLSAENSQLQEGLNVQQHLSSYIEDQKVGKGDLDKVIETLMTDNQHLKFALQTKEDQIQVLMQDQSDRPAVQAYRQLQHKYKQLFRETHAREQLYVQQQDEKRHLVAQARERTSLIRENQILKGELESYKQSITSLRKLESQCGLLKRERAEYRTKFEALTLEKEHLQKKLSRVTAEHQVLISEYEKIFGFK
jgi:hypothetical protein